MTETVSFSMAFIFTFFMAGLTGYYVGSQFLGWSLAHSLMLALGFIVVTLIVETSLFIIKQNKKKVKVQQRKYRSEYDNGIERSEGKERVAVEDKKKKKE